MPPVPPLGLELQALLRIICDVLARHGGLHRAAGPLVAAIWNRLHRLAFRLDRLAAAFAAGRLPKRRIRAKRAAKPRTPTDAPKIPTGHGWLARNITHRGANQERVGLYLQRDDLQALVAAHPPAGRLLRPWVRMFGLPMPAWLALPPRPRKPRIRKPRPPRLRLQPIHLTRRQIDRMTAADLTALFGRMPPHFPLPVPNFNYIRRKIAAG